MLKLLVVAGVLVNLLICEFRRPSDAVNIYVGSSLPEILALN